MQSNYVLAVCILGSIFCVMGWVFFFAKEKACILISGYNFKTKEERKQYDERKMSKDFQTFSFICSDILFVSALGCIFISDFCFFIGLFLWGIYFFKHVGLSDKHFDKYKKCNRVDSKRKY